MHTFLDNPFPRSPMPGTSDWKGISSTPWSRESCPHRALSAHRSISEGLSQLSGCETPVCLELLCKAEPTWVLDLRLCTVEVCCSHSLSLLQEMVAAFPHVPQCTSGLFGGGAHSPSSAP